jgi:signal transduction histidine kinase
MATEARKTGLDVGGAIPWGTHFCHFYETKEDLLAILVPYFKTGLENNEFCLWVFSDSVGEEEARDALRRALPEADRHLAEGHLEMVRHTEWYLKDAFVPERVLKGWHDKLARALADGYAGMRVAGDLSWLTREDWKDFAQYERTLDDTLANHRMIVLCSYPLSRAGAAEIFDVVRTHQFAVARRRGRWDVVESPEIKEAKAEIKRLNEDLERRVVERTQQLRALSARLQTAREEERTRIAREIHDALGSALTALKWGLEELQKLVPDSGGVVPLPTLREKIDGMMRLAGGTMHTVRRIAWELRPSILDDLGLMEAIEWQVQQFEAQTGIVCHYDCALEDFSLSPEQSTAVFRIFQEALTNVRRHANATRVDVTISKSAGDFTLTIRDNGRGIRDEERSGQLSLGLLGMQERAHLVGGRIDIAGSQGEGTVVTVRVPSSKRRAA